MTTKTWHDPRIPAADECVLRPVLATDTRPDPAWMMSSKAGLPASGPSSSKPVAAT
mgnify:CR=1 FL=1